MILGLEQHVLETSAAALDQFSVCCRPQFHNVSVNKLLVVCFISFYRSVSCFNYDISFCNNSFYFVTSRDIKKGEKLFAWFVVFKKVVDIMTQLLDGQIVSINKLFLFFHRNSFHFILFSLQKTVDGQ